MPKMKELVVRAGKYCSVGLLCIACLPVLLPSLFFLSFFGFAFVLPTVCALAGFLYLRKYVGMLYRKLPISILAAGCTPWRGRRHSQESVAPTFLMEFPRRDLHAIETFEVVDPEFDAVLISTAPREVQRENTEGARDADILAGLGAVLGTDVSADHATRIEGLDVDAIPSDAATVRENDDEDPLVENGTRGQGTDDDSSAESGTRGQGIDDDAEIGASRELREDDTSAEGTIKEQIDGDTIAEDETRRQGIVEATSAENGNREHGVDDEMITEGIVKVACAEDGKRKQGIDEDTSADDANGRTGIVEETFADDGNRKKRRVEVTSTEDRNRTEGIDEVLPTEDGTRRDGIHDHISATDGSRREGVDEDTSVENMTRRHVREDCTSLENGTGRDEGEDDTSVGAETRRWGRDDDQQSEEEVGGTAVVEGSELRELAGSKQLLEDVEGEGDEVEHPKEDKVERDVLVDTERDDGFQTLSIGANSRGSGGILKGENISPEVSEIEAKGYESEVEPEPEDNSHPEVVKEEQEDNDEGVNKALDGKAKEQKIELLPDDCNLPQALDEDDQERTLAASTAAAPVTPDASPVASRIKPERVKRLLPHQADENDIWICKECGWRYPNAKPSAKIRRNHKKHCKGSRSPAAEASQDEGMHTETPQQNESAKKSKKDLKASGPLAGSLATERRSSAPADEERMQCSPSRLEDDDIISLHDHNSNGVAFDDDGGGVAVSSANSRGYVGQSSGVESESFRSADFEFPSNRSESFRSADFEFPSITSESFSSVDEGFSEVRWASFPSVESHFHDEQDQLDQVQVKQELQLSEDLNAVKGIVGDKHVSTGPLLSDIEELSEFLGIDLPPKSADLPEIEWAKLAIEVMKVVVGID